MKRLWGFKRLVHDAIDETTHLVQETHNAVAAKPLRYLKLIQPLAGTAQKVHDVQKLASSGIYSTIRLVNLGVSKLTDAGYELARASGETPQESAELATPMRSDAMGGMRRSLDSLQGALNGVIGDYLHKRGNELDIDMGFRHEGRALSPRRDALESTLPRRTPRLCIFVHGLSCTERSWNLHAEQYHGDASTNFGTLLARDLGYTPLYVHYNSGLHISQNGRRLSELIEELLKNYPVPVEQIVLIGHSMGGLLIRSAAHHGDRHAAEWVEKLTHVFCIGAPHLGAPLEKATNVLTSVLRIFDTPGTRIPAVILDTRSAGIKDLRFGYTVDEEWQDEDPDALLEDNRLDIPLVDHAGYFFIAGTLTEDPSHPATQLLGDLLVRLPSAAGLASEHTRRVRFKVGRVFPAMRHLTLINHPDVYETIRRWCIERD